MTRTRRIPTAGLDDGMLDEDDSRGAGGGGRRSSLASNVSMPT